MAKKLNIESWKRKEHFKFFSQFDEPFFGIVSEIDCTSAFKIAKEKKYSFFSYYLHKSLLAVNAIEEFRYRIEDDNVILYDDIHASATIGRDDGTFGFSLVPFNSDFELFDKSLKEEISNVKNSSGLRLKECDIQNNIIHYSSIPWNKFTAVTHARNFKIVDSVPKIVFGKTFMRDESRIMPVSVNLHHGLADGLHASKFLELFQTYMDDEK